jgi:chemosensory pili system protein ChpA (sensor histidine kinase/response regulator)
MHSEPTKLGEIAAVEPDLGPLAWVLDELRKSLDGAIKALKRFVRDAELARGSDLAALDASQLRIARQQLHQAVGALEMVGLEVPARMLRGMEALTQKFVQRPEFCSDEAALKVEHASFALTDYLEGLLKGRGSSSVALFPQYRDVLELLGEERVHPADLWAYDWRWVDVPMPSSVVSMTYDTTMRSRVDGYVLSVIQSNSKSCSQAMADMSRGFAAAQSSLHPRVFWAVASAYFESLNLGLCQADVYTKRAASQVLSHYRSLARGDTDVSDRLVQDLLFFCSQAVPSANHPAPALKAVRRVYGLTSCLPVDYLKPQFGLFDPAVLVQARKRIAAATETWSTLSGGDVHRIKTAADQFGLVAESILKLHPGGAALAAALTRAMDVVARSGKPPAPALAMEVATAVLYLEAAYDDLDPTNEEMATRSLSLAKRLNHVIDIGESEPLEGWMEDLYRRVSDRQIMGSVVDELRTTLSDIEGSLDAFFRRPNDKQPLHEVPGKLASMRGVFSVLGLEQPALAALRMRDQVEQCLLSDAVSELGATGLFEKLGNSLGVMGFLIDMLSYQRELAKKLFVYDEGLGEFRSLMGRSKVIDKEVSNARGRVNDAPQLLAEPVHTEPLVAQQMQPAVVLQSMVQSVPVHQPASLAQPAHVVPQSVASDDDDDTELREIFLEEARGVFVEARDVLGILKDDPTALDQQAGLRRAFHTLKGSSRMVGLNEFGEAAWAMEQLLNAWLPRREPASPELITLSGQAFDTFELWVNDIESSEDAHWSAQPFRKAADLLRLENVASKLMPQTLNAVWPEEQEIEEDTQIQGFDELDFTAHSDHETETETHAIVQIDEPSDERPKARGIHEYESVHDADFETTALQDFDETQFLSQVEHDVLATSAKGNTEAENNEESLLSTEFMAEFDENKAIEPELPEEAKLDPTVACVDGVPDKLADAEDQVKVIGSLRISIPLYNVYLNEADEWSRRLQTELTEWAMELNRPLPEPATALAHSLAGSSATVGFMALSELSRALEHALAHVQLAGVRWAAHATLFVAVAEDVRRLLHQFAAGFLKQSDPDHLTALHALLDTDFSAESAEVAGTEADWAEDFVVSENEFDSLFGTEALPKPKPEAVGHTAPSHLPLQVQALDVSKAPSGLASRGLVGDDIEAQDVLDVDLFPIFEEEALDLLPQLSSALRQWSARPDNLKARQEALRLLHTLKGSARLAGAMRLGEMSHRLESEAERIDAENANTQDLEPLLASLDKVVAVFEALRATPEQALKLPEAADPSEDNSTTAANTVESSSLSIADASAGQVAAPKPAFPMRRSARQTVRISSRVLDRMVNQAGEVMMTRARLEARLGQLRGSLNELTSNLDRLRNQLRDIELQSESQMQSRLAQTKDSVQGFDPLEFDRFTRVQELTRMMAESVHDVATLQRSLQQTVEGVEDDLIAQARQARELQRDLLRTRMVEFDSISERLYGVVRQAAKELDKQVKLDIVGGSQELDRGVLERVAPAFEHLLRNSVGHGIEVPELRQTLGKSALGTISIQLEQHGNDVVLTFRDDGAGLDLERIRAKALAQGLISNLDTLTDDQVANLIFTSGLSTASQVSELAGRGIGMDVVRNEINALGGRVELSTQTGQGTQFKLVLPLTTAVTHVVLLRLGETVMGVPSGLVELVRRVPAAELRDAYSTGDFNFNGERIPFYWAGALLQASRSSTEALAKNASVAIFRSAGQRVALHVNEVLGNQEVVVKNLGPQLSKLPGLTGMSVLASGAVVLIYNPVALAVTYGSQARAFGAPQAIESEGLAAQVAVVSAPQVPLVLVVDDSITVRRVTQRLLKREGFRVALAADGLQALEMLQGEKPAVVLTDIEMPRMDGFDLVRNIRNDKRLIGMPIIMITSRIAEKHRDYARELKVDHYLGKPYPEDELITLVRQYCEAQALLQP